MTKHYNQHANEVVESFLGLLPDDSRQALSEEHTDELTLLVESAISISVVKELEHAADQLLDASLKLRERAERYD